MGYKQDKGWEESLHEQAIAILKMHLVNFLLSSLHVKTATDEQDRKYATDFVIEFVNATVACRIRRGEKCHWRQLTLRIRRMENRNVELKKIIDGYAKVYFYAWTENNVIVEWIIVDLDKLRVSGLLQKERKEISNHDGTYFIAIDLEELRDTDCLIAEHVVKKSAQRTVNTHSPMKDGIKKAMSAIHKSGDYTSQFIEPLLTPEEIVDLELSRYERYVQQWLWREEA